MAEKK